MARSDVSGEKALHLGWLRAEGYLSLPSECAAESRFCTQRGTVRRQNILRQTVEGRRGGSFGVVKDYDGDTYSGPSIPVRFARAVYGSHAFQKKFAARNRDEGNPISHWFAENAENRQRDYERRYGQRHHKRM